MKEDRRSYGQTKKRSVGSIEKGQRGRRNEEKTHRRFTVVRPCKNPEETEGLYE